MNSRIARFRDVRRHESGDRLPVRFFARLWCWLLIGLLVPALSLAADRYWIGAGGNWNNTANWSTTSGGGGGASVPGSSDVAIFDVNSGDCTTYVSVNVQGVDITADYSGTVTVDGANTVQVGSAHYQQAGGAFIGGTGQITIYNCDFNQTGGTFTHTNGLMEFRSHATRNIVGQPELGDVRISTGGGGGTYPHVISAASTVTVHGAVSFTSHAGRSQLNGTGVMEVHGDVETRDLTARSSAWLVLCGSGDQTVAGLNTHDRGYLPNLRIDKPSGDVIFEGTPHISGHIEHLSGGFNTATSAVTFYAHTSDGSTFTSTVAQLTFHDLRFIQAGHGGDNQHYYLAPNLTLDVTNQLVFAGPGLRVHNGTINVHGNMSVSSHAYNQSTTEFQIIGDGDQTIAASGGMLPALIIDKPSGNLYLDGHLRFYHGGSPAPNVVFNHQAGTIVPGASLVHFLTYNRNTTVTSAVGQLVFHDLRIESTGGGGTYNFDIAPNTTLVSTGTLSFARTAGSIRLRNRSLYARGHIHNIGGIIIPNSDERIELLGDAVQQIDATGLEDRTRLDLYIDKDGGEVRLVSDFELNQANRRLDVASGILNIGTNILTFSGNSTVYSNSPDAELHLTLASTNTLIRQTGSGSQALINGKLFVERADGFVTPPEKEYMILESATAVDINPPHAPFETDGRTGEHTLLYDVLYNEGGNNIILANVRIARGMLIMFR